MAQNNPMDTMRLDELVELMLDVVCSKRAAIRIAGENMPAEVVKSRFLKLNAEHIQYVLDCLKDNPPRIRNIKQYLLADALQCADDDRKLLCRADRPRPVRRKEVT